MYNENFCDFRGSISCMKIWLGLQALHQKKRERGVMYPCSCFPYTFAKFSSALSLRWIRPFVNIQWFWSATPKENAVIAAIDIKTVLLVANKWVHLHSFPNMAVGKRHRHNCKSFVFSAGCRLPGTEWNALASQDFLVSSTGVRNCPTRI